MPAGEQAHAGTPRIRFMAARAQSILTCWAAAVALWGCEPSSEIVVERVPKDHQATAPPLAEAQPAQEKRMLAAMVLESEEAVFFKVTGPPNDLQGLREPFLEMVSSFEPGDPPTWTVPDDWSQSSGRGERLATITVPGEPPLELSVTSLPLRMDDKDAYRLANVNRWRRQLGLAPVREQALNAGSESGAETFQVPLDGEGTATVVDIVGTGSGGMGGPFASRMPSAEGGGRRETESSEQTGAGLSFTKPEGWEKARASAFSRLAFSAGDARVTVSALSAEANDLLSNVNLWRGQAGMEPLDEEQLPERLQTITLGDGKDGHYVVLAGNAGRSILGVIAERGEAMWFVKMDGSEATIANEKSRFEEFVKSLAFDE